MPKGKLKDAIERDFGSKTNSKSSSTLHLSGSVSPVQLLQRDAKLVLNYVLQNLDGHIPVKATDSELQPNAYQRVVHRSRSPLVCLSTNPLTPHAQPIA